MVYNMTNITLANDLITIVAEVNNTSGGYLLGFTLFAFYIVTMFIFKNKDIVFVFLADSFIVTIVAVIMWAMGYIGLNLLTIPLLLLFVGLMMKLFQPR